MKMRRRWRNRSSRVGRGGEAVESEEAIEAAEVEEAAEAAGAAKERVGGKGRRGFDTGSGSVEGVARVWLCYKDYPPTLYLQGEVNEHNFLAGEVIPIVQGPVLCKNWHLYGLCWEECEH